MTMSEIASNTHFVFTCDGLPVSSGHFHVRNVPRDFSEQVDGRKKRIRNLALFLSGPRLTA